MRCAGVFAFTMRVAECSEAAASWRCASWKKQRQLSSAANRYNRDYLGETAEGSQMPMLNAFHRESEAIRHFWGAELLYAPTDPGQEYRHVGTIEPLWNVFDLTPEGCGTDWDEQLSYSCCGARVYCRSRPLFEHYFGLQHLPSLRKQLQK